MHNPKHKASTIIHHLIFADMKSFIKNSRKHDIAFHPSGQIDISARIARRMSLSPGDVIDIAEENGEWYIYVRFRAGSYTGRHQGRVWTTGRNCGTYRLCSKAITDAVLAIARSTQTLRCPCGNEIEIDNKKYITIIYRCKL